MTSIANNQDVFTIIFEDRNALSDADQDRLRDLERRYVRVFTTIADATIDAGVLPLADPRQTALAIIGLGTWVYKWFDPERDDLDAFIATSVALIMEPRPRSPGERRARSSRSPTRGHT